MKPSSGKASNSASVHILPAVSTAALIRRLYGGKQPVSRRKTGCSYPVSDGGASGQSSITEAKGGAAHLALPPFPAQFSSSIRQRVAGRVRRLLGSNVWLHHAARVRLRRKGRAIGVDSRLPQRRRQSDFDNRLPWRQGRRAQR